MNPESLPVLTGDQPVTRAGRSHRLGQLGRWSGAGLLSLPLILFFFIPVAALLLRTSGADILADLRRPEALQAIELSLRTTLITVLLTVILGTPLAYLLARRR